MKVQIVKNGKNLEEKTCRTAKDVACVLAGKPDAIWVEVDSLYHRAPGSGEKLALTPEVFCVLFQDFPRDTRRQKRWKQRHMAVESVCWHEEAGKHFGALNTVADCCEVLHDRERIQQALQTLNATQRKRVEMYCYGALSIPEIARAEGVSHQNVSKSIRRAYRNMKKFLK